jgi:hypothetical protein
MGERDIVERLRSRVEVATASRPPRRRQDLPLMSEAADEIERLRRGECICIRCGQRQNPEKSNDALF